MSNKLYLTNLASETNEAELHQIFGEVGTVLSVRVSPDPRGSFQNYAFVEMGTEELTEAAVQHVNGYILHERRIMITELRSRPEREISSEETTSKTSRRRGTSKKPKK